VTTAEAGLLSLLPSDDSRPSYLFFCFSSLRSFSKSDILISFCHSLILLLLLTPDPTKKPNSPLSPSDKG
jgi:hypothetical protein